MVPALPQHNSLEAPRTVGGYHSGGASMRDESPSNSSDGFGAPGGSPSAGGNGGYDESEPIINSYARQTQAQHETTPPHFRPGASGQFSQPPGSGYFNQPPQTVSYDQQAQGGGYPYTNPTSSPPSAYSTPPPASSRRQETRDVVPPPAQGLPRPKPGGARRASAQTPQSQSPVPAPQSRQAPSPNRGYTLTDPGVVNPPASASNPNVRRISRTGGQPKRTSTTPVGGYPSGATSPPPPSVSSQGGGDAQGQGRNRRSTAQLPPGAAPPQYPRYGS